MHDRRQLLPQNMNLYYYQIFFTQIRLFWNNWSSVIKNHNIDHYSNSIFITELEFENKNDIQSTIKNLEITLILIKLWRGGFSTSLFLSISHFWSKIQTQWWKLSWNNGQYCDFWSQNSNYSKISEFARKKSIIIQILI